MYFLVCRSELACNWGPGKGGGGGGHPKERGGDARRKFCFKPQREINLGVAQLFLTPKETILNFDYINRVNKTN